MKVVLDTMLWVSCCTRRDGSRHRLIDRALKARVRLFVSDYILDELSDALREELDESPRYVHLARRAVLRRAKRVALPAYIRAFVPGDPKDVQTAISSKSDYLVTADAVLLELGKKGSERGDHKREDFCRATASARVIELKIGATVRVGLTEADVENLAIDWFRSLGYDYALGSEISPGGTRPLRESVTEAALVTPLRDAIARLNPTLPATAVDDALRQALRQPTPSLVENNFRFHKLLTDGVQVEYRRADGKVVGAFARLVVRQYSVRGDRGALKRMGLVVFVNGLPLGVIEVKDPTDEQADIWKAYDDLQEYKAEVPALFGFNELLVISDGVETRLGSITSDPDRFAQWKTIDGTPVTAARSSLEVLIRGVFDKQRLLELVRHFVVFEVDVAKIAKKIAQYHQFHATAKALDATVRASRAGGDRRCGVIWHTQGSGKSLTMLCYAGKLIAEPAMENPTLVLLTDRNDLDNQLLGTFGKCKALLRQDPVQAESREHLRDLLNRASGGVIFTTIHKFAPPSGQKEQAVLSDRRNIVVIADEAHRSQYAFLDGLARHMRDALPGAAFIGFTGTPIELKDANTRAVFGEYIDIYDIKQAVDDQATVNIYYVSIDWTIKESVRAKLRSAVKRVLRKYGYPPDKQESATDLVLQQAELLCAELTT